MRRFNPRIAPLVQFSRSAAMRFTLCSPPPPRKMVRVWMREGVLTYYVLLEEDGWPLCRRCAVCVCRKAPPQMSRTVYVFLRSFAGGHLAEWQFRRILV